MTGKEGIKMDVSPFAYHNDTDCSGDIKSNEYYYEKKARELLKKLDDRQPDPLKLGFLVQWLREFKEG